MIDLLLLWSFMSATSGLGVVGEAAIWYAYFWVHG